jgi:DNA-binding MarR family transcriptional regulator
VPDDGAVVRGMSDAWGGTVNLIFFGLKRAFHGTLRVTRRMLTRLGLTAARFDLLYALPHGGFRAGPGILQSLLRRQLGVSRPTVSRMLASLEELGLVTRRRHELDRRQVFVALTLAGRRLLRRAKRAFIESGYVQLAVDTALGHESSGGPSRDRWRTNRWYDDSHCLVEMDRLDGILGNVRYEFGDFARLYYPWHPDD